MKILHLDFLGSGADEEYEFPLGGVNFYVRHTKLDRDIRRLKKLLTHHTEEAVALSGLSLTFYIGGKSFPNRRLASEFESALKGVHFSDGSLVRDTLERYLVLRAIQSLSFNFKGRRTLIFSALTRFGATEVLANYTKRLIIGDLLYGMRLGVPIFSLAAFKKSATALIDTVTRMPISWFSPAGRAFPRRLPSFRWYFYWAEVILGGMEYLLRYSPQKLSDKLVFTDIHGEEEIDFLARKGVATIVNVRPNIGAIRLSSSILGVAIQRLTGISPEDEGKLREAYLNFYVKEHFEPEIIHFKPEKDVEPSLIEKPSDFYLSAERVTVEEEATSGREKGVQKFGFVVHPLTYSHLLRHKLLNKLDKLLPESVVEGIAGGMGPIYMGEVKNVTSPTGVRAEGYVYALPMTSKLMLRSNPELVYRKILRICELAHRQGAGIIGLGAYTSIVGDAGVSIANRSPIPVTTGNSFTVAVTLETIRKASELLGYVLSESCACVIGATGSIGSILSLILGGMVKRIMLSAPRSERLIALSKTLTARYPSLDVYVATDPAVCLESSDIIVTTTSAVDPIVKVERLKPGAIVCDVARPPDVSEDSAKMRPDVLVIESGEVELPEGAEITCDIGLPKGISYACLAETIILALSNRFENFTVGREIDEERVRLISELGNLHGFRLAGIRSFGTELSQEDLLKIREKAQVLARG